MDQVTGGESTSAISVPTSKVSSQFIKTKDAYVLEDFKIVVKLGKGAFGNVYLIELPSHLNAAPNQAKPMRFALKAMDKSMIM